MLKHINNQNVTTTPFVAVKSRVLSNTQNSDVIITELNGYTDGTSISLDYIDYNVGDPQLNRDCDIALEQQSSDILGFEEGALNPDPFDPNVDEKNENGSFKSLVHRTTKNSFYNSYQNPTQIFGIENIDFSLSKTLRNLADQFRMFSLPNTVFGDKIKPGSVQFFDTNLDDNVTIIDDGFQNLIGGYNLFSKVQEIKWVSPDGQNYIITGSITSSYMCPSFDSLQLTNPSNKTATVGTNISFSVSASGTPRPITFQWYSGSNALTDGGSISGSHGPVLYILNVQVSNDGNYFVVAHNAATTGITSSIANFHTV